MARITMTGGYRPIPEGEQVLKITDVKHDVDFGKVCFTLMNADNLTHRETFYLLNNDNTPNERAMNAFSFFAKNAMNDFDMEDVDPVELVGRYIRVEVIHNKVPSNQDPTKTKTFVNLGSKSPADGFDGVPTEPTKPAGLDLNALLGN